MKQENDEGNKKMLKIASKISANKINKKARESAINIINNNKGN